MGEEAAFWTGLLLGAVVAILLIWFSLVSDSKECAKKYNVYKCDRVYVPVVTEGE
jgi:hypothetical protein